MRSNRQNHTHTIPAEITDALDKVLLNLKVAVLINGSLTLLMAGITLFATFILLDYLTFIDSALATWIISLINFTTMGVIFYRVLFVPLKKKITHTQIARMLEIKNPQLEERISSALQLAEENRSVSPELITELIEKATIDINLVTQTSTFSFRKYLKPLITAVAAIITVTLIFFLSPLNINNTITRVILPFYNVGNIHSSKLKVLPGSRTIIAGESLKITVRTTDTASERVEFRKRGESGVDLIERMVLTSETDKIKTYNLELPTVENSFEYRIKTKNGLTKYFRIRVIKTPKLEKVTVKHEFPKYTSQEPLIEENNKYLKALQGSKLSFTAHFSKPVHAELIVGSYTLKPEASTEGYKAEHTWIVNIDKKYSKPLQTWMFQATDQNGNNYTSEKYQLIVSQDTVPSVRITDPQKKAITLNNYDTLNVTYFAYDDFEINRPQLTIVRNGNVIETRSLDKPESHKENMWVGKAQLNFNSIDLSDGSKVSLQISVCDTFPGSNEERHTGYSEKVVITIDNKAELLDKVKIDGQFALIKNKISEIIKDLDSANSILVNIQNTESENGQWKNELKKFSKAEKLIKRAMQKTHTATLSTANIQLTDITDKLESVQSEYLSKTVKRIEFMMLSEEEEHAEQLSQLISLVDNTLTALRNILDELEPLKTKYKKLAELNAIANLQASIAGEANSIKSTAEHKKWKSRQLKVAEKLAQIIKTDQTAKKQNTIHSIQTLEGLIEKSERIINEIERKKQLTVNLKTDIKELILDCIAIALSIEFTDDKSEETKYLKAAAIRLNKQIALSNLKALNKSLYSLLSAQIEQKRTTDKSALNGSENNLSRSLYNSLKANLAGTIKDSAKHAESSNNNMKKMMLGSSFNTGSAITYSSDTGEAVVPESKTIFGESTGNWSDLKGSIKSSDIGKIERTEPEHYSDLVDRYFKEIRKTQ